MIDIKYKEMIDELILFYWVDLQPSKKVDVFINEYMKETKQTPEILVENVIKATK